MTYFHLFETNHAMSMSMPVCNSFLISAYFLQGLLKDITGNYVASFIVAGSFLILGTLTMVTLPHYFSCTDPPPPQRRSRDDKEKSYQPELEQINSSPCSSDTSNGGAQ